MTLLAHAGGLGWDELVFLAIPVVVLALLGWQARKKADAAGANGTGESPKDPEAPE